MFRSLLVHVLVLAGVVLGLLARTAESGGEQLVRAEHAAATRLAGGDLEPGDAIYLAGRLAQNQQGTVASLSGVMGARFSLLSSDADVAVGVQAVARRELPRK